MRVTGANRLRLKLAVPAALAVAMVTYGAVAWAGGSTGDLQTEVQELQQEVQELKGEVTTLKTQQTVQVPTEGAKPTTIGQQVGSLGKDLGDLKTNLSTNLGVHIHGLVDTTYEYNVNEPNTSGNNKGGVNAIATGGRLNQLRVFDTNANSFDLEQFNIHIDRTADGGVGFVSDINFGEVANVLRASTRNSNINPAATSNDIIDPTQAYLTYTVPVGTGINMSAGRFVTLLGEEIIPTWNANNFNISRDFIFGFAIPFTNTGVRAQYAFNPAVGVTLGVNNGWDSITDANDGKTVEGQLNLTPTANTSFVLNGIYGAEQVNRGNTQRWVIDPIATWHTPLTGLQLVGEFVYGSEGPPISVVPLFTSHGNSLNKFPAGPNGTVTFPNTATWSAAAGYIVYDWTESIEFALRGEWFRDAQGVRTGLRQTLGEVTGTLNYKVPGVTGLLARLEYRHDESNQKPFFSNQLAPIGSPLFPNPLHTYAGQDTVMAAAVYSF
jgi:Putative beta-barrel porin-2, OmpL-like. bbp2